MKFRNDDQRKAYFAQLNKQGRVKKAAIGLGTAALAGTIALKSKNSVLARRAAATAIAGLTAAAGYGGAQLQRVQDAKKRTQENIRATTLIAKAHAQSQTAAALEAVRGANVESLALRGTDWAFQIPESFLSQQIMKRAANIEAVAAKKLGEVQSVAGVMLADKARKTHTTMFGPRSANNANLHKASAELFKQRYEELTQRRKLRSAAEFDREKMMRAVRSGMSDMVRKGHMRFPNEDEIRTYLARQGQDATQEKIREYSEWYRRMMFPSIF